MNTTDHVRELFDSLHQRIDVVMQDIDEGTFNWHPPGTANPIAITYLHMLNAEDFHIQAILQGKPRIWESGDWSESIGVSAPPGRGRNWEESQGAALNLSTLLDYQQAVRAATSLYFAELDDTTLAGPVNFPGDDRSVLEVINALVIHLAGHAGEIAAIKGVQGLKGLPF